MFKYKTKMNLTVVLGSAAPMLFLLSCLVGLVSSDVDGVDPDAHLVHLDKRVERSTTPATPQIPTMADMAQFFPPPIDTNRCKANTTYIWCLPPDYNQEKHPFTLLYGDPNEIENFQLVNRSLPWDYNFRFVIEEISAINDKAQTMSVSMYFGVSWMEPRLRINSSALEWTEDRTGPKNQVNESPESLKYIWYPELEIYGLELFGRQRVLKEMSGVRIRKNKTINYELGTRITISCKMNFDNYPLDAHTCQFQVGSYYDTNQTVTCKSDFIYDSIRQRSLQHFIKIEDLPKKFATITLPSGNYATCGFQVRLQRKQMQFLVQVYLPSIMFVIVSWVSFLIRPEVVPGRMALLVTLFLVLINIFNSVREQAPISSRLNAIDLYLVVCIFLVFGALMEYAVVLLLLKKRRKPRRTIDAGLKNLFNGDASQPLDSPAGRDGENANNRKRQMIVAYSDNDTVVTEAIPPEPPPRKKKMQANGNRIPQTMTPLLQDWNPGEVMCTATHANPHAVSSSSKPVDAFPDPRKQALCDNIDNWSLWLSPPAFITFNIVYWVAYRHVDHNDLDIHGYPIS